ncbi:cupin domain-containing protein [Novosphingobium sp. JCM 18896]|uniref:cupin domain-containing protein n=1 Tax=Novosphingobium sp. JCM 18896 TaxID=2989731 RepID=UPI002221769A|nr:cupin domain-containing protein [Novosphingobium sp. JCM 18896]MCW1431855.1 cupin domain-containing protein [Novosphingobium sp. JCM 18896]
MAELNRRRVVTGLDAQGRSTVLIDGPIPHAEETTAALVWRTHAHPADNAGSDDPVAPYETAMLHTPGSNFAICQFRPRTPEIMHATNTIDYLVILSGRVTLVLEEGETELGAGDCVVDRGVVHGWRNPHDEPCVAAVVNLPAYPVGKGRTI